MTLILAVLCAFAIIGFLTAIYWLLGRVLTWLGVGE